VPGASGSGPGFSLAINHADALDNVRTDRISEPVTHTLSLPVPERLGHRERFSHRVAVHEQPEYRAEPAIPFAAVRARICACRPGHRLT